MRSGGFSARVPCAVEALTIEVVLSEPQAASTAAAKAAPTGPRNLYMPDS
jgi:hypothetical protein